MGFFYSFTETILHSLWQGLLLALFYIIVNLIFKKNHPLQKRNFLYFLLVFQFCISLFTFLCYFNDYNAVTAFAFTNSFNFQYFSFLGLYNNYIFSIYIGIVIVKLAALWLQWFYFKRNFKNELFRPTASLKIFTETKAYQLGIKRKVEIWYSNNIKTPITFGHLKPIILLPLALVNNISIKQTETIIIHELVHIKSKDYLFNWLLLVIEIVYFFNPFIRLLIQKLKQEREKNCDTQVINFNYETLQYAQTLLGIAKNNAQVKDFQLGFIKKGSQLLHRIRFFSNEKNLVFRNTNPLSFLLFFLPLMFFICFVIIGTLPKKINSNYTADFVTANDFIQNKMMFTANVAAISPIIKNMKAPYSTYRVKASSKKVYEKILNIDIDEIINTNKIYTPVALNETADSSKEIIYNLETQNGKITQSYKLIQKNGKWIFEPLWMIVETKPKTYPILDSLTFFNAPDSIQ